MWLEELQPKTHPHRLQSRIGRQEVQLETRPSTTSNLPRTPGPVENESKSTEEEEMAGFQVQEQQIHHTSEELGRR